MLARADAPSLLLIAPTGGGKTLAGFLPTLIELADGTHEGLHTLYVSPLKALANDIKRNLRTPIEEAGFPIRVEDRTGDTPQTQRKRQRADPPHILLTTPESLALMISYPDAGRTFKGLKRIIVDEIHALADSKRGDQLMLCLSRLQTLAPACAGSGFLPQSMTPPSLHTIWHATPTHVPFCMPTPARRPTSRSCQRQMRHPGPVRAVDMPFLTCWPKFESTTRR